jgi:hypothetical protein
MTYYFLFLDFVCPCRIRKKTPLQTQQWQTKKTTKQPLLKKAKRPVVQGQHWEPVIN